MSYDKNGNILSLQRTGGQESPTIATPIDNLTYTYDTVNKNNNKLLSVTDATNCDSGFNDGNTAGNDYDYDVYGNMTKDLNKAITNIKYNHLNLPTEINFATGNKITYLYTATGEKMQKLVVSGNTTSTTNYWSGFQYNNNILIHFPTAEGYVKVSSLNGNTLYSYVYHYKDHLGNIRLSYSLDTNTGNLATLEEHHYYPFGLEHVTQIEWNIVPIQGPQGIKPTFTQVANNGYQYQYQGQERQDELGLNWDSFKYRNYDYAIGRFMSIDPLAEKYSYNGVYNFSENRVVDGRELEGLEVVLINPTKSSSNEQQKAADQRIVNGTKSIPNSRTMITIAAHGNPKFLLNDFRGQQIKTGEQLNAVLNRNSEDWKNKESGEGMTVVLYSCRTGSDVKDENGNTIDQSVAQKISASEEFKDVEIIAPDQRVYFTEDGPIGTYEAQAQEKNGEYKSNSDGSRKNDKMSNTTGNWNVYKNGELIRSYQGDWKPTDNPSLWDRLTKEN